MLQEKDPLPSNPHGRKSNGSPRGRTYSHITAAADPEKNKIKTQIDYRVSWGKLTGLREIANGLFFPV